MAKAIFNVLFNVIIAFANTLFLPINTILSTFVPNLSQAISNTITGFNIFCSNLLAWGFAILPPNARYLVIFYLTFLVSYYTISYSIHAVVWVINVIKKLPLA